MLRAFPIAPADSLRLSPDAAACVSVADSAPDSMVAGERPALASSSMASAASPAENDVSAPSLIARSPSDFICAAGAAVAAATCPIVCENVDSSFTAEPVAAAIPAARPNPRDCLIVSPTIAICPRIPGLPRAANASAPRPACVVIPVRSTPTRDSAPPMVDNDAGTRPEADANAFVASADLSFTPASDANAAATPRCALTMDSPDRAAFTCDAANPAAACAARVCPAPSADNDCTAVVCDAANAFVCTPAVACACPRRVVAATAPACAAPNWFDAAAPLSCAAPSVPAAAACRVSATASCPAAPTAFVFAAVDA